MLVKKSFTVKGVLEFAGHHLWWLVAYILIVAVAYKGTGFRFPGCRFHWWERRLRFMWDLKIIKVMTVSGKPGKSGERLSTAAGAGV